MSQAIEEPTPTRISEELLKAVSGDDCIAWIGSGLSSLAYPNWVTAIAALCAACGVQPFGPAETPSADQLIDKAQECKTANTNTYRATLGDLFGGNIVEQRQAYSWLMSAHDCPDAGSQLHADRS